MVDEFAFVPDDARILVDGFRGEYSPAVKPGAPPDDLG
jgi:hypothetical protein